MPDIDDEVLRRRIRATLEAAGSDAPSARALEVAVHSPPASRRWWAAAAAAVLVLSGAVALGVRHDGDTAGPATSLPSNTVDTAPPTEPPPSSTIALQDEDCAVVAPQQYDNQGSMHTIVPNAQPIDVSVSFSPGSWCSGGHAQATVTFTNHGAGVEHLDAPMLILNGGMAKWPITDLASFDLAPGEHKDVTTIVQVPNAPPGSYLVHIYGFDGGAQVEVRGAVVCDGSNLAGVASGQDGAMGNVRTDLVVTNTSDAPCLLTKPWAVMALTDPNGFTQIPFGEGTYFGDPDPLPTRVLQPGASALMILGMSNGCDDPTKAYTWDHLQFMFGAFDTTDLNVPMTLASPTCGLSLSAWGAPRT